MITINFANFHIEIDFDYIEIYDGVFTSDTKIGDYYSGDTGPGNVTGSSHNLLVTFISDASYQRSGFSATFVFECKHNYGHS